RAAAVACGSARLDGQGEGSCAGTGSAKRICPKNSPMRPQNRRRAGTTCDPGIITYVPDDAATLFRRPRAACGPHLEGLGRATTQRGEVTMRLRLGQALALVSLAGALSCTGLIQAGWGQQQRKAVRAPTTVETGETSKVYKVNNWTLGLAGGTLEGTFIRLAAEATRVVNDPEELRVLPV